MAAIKNTMKRDENKDLVAVCSGNPKGLLEKAVSSREALNQLQQEYYNKTSGCSVKAQEDNLFDYKIWSKK